jgi:hypothetical protein
VSEKRKWFKNTDYVRVGYTVQERGKLQKIMKWEEYVMLTPGKIPQK